MTTATFVKDLDWQVHAAKKLWRLSELVEYDDNQKTDYVVTSAANAPFSGPETYIFPADKDGEIKSWLEMTGSYRGGLDHKEAISNAGWKISEPAQS